MSSQTEDSSLLPEKHLMSKGINQKNDICIFSDENISDQFQKVSRRNDRFL